MLRRFNVVSLALIVLVALCLLWLDWNTLHRAQPASSSHTHSPSLAERLARHARPHEAYVTVVGGAQLDMFDSYAFSALALLSSVALFDSARPRVVLLDTLGLELFPTARALFEASGIVVVPVEPRTGDAVLASGGPLAWRAAFTKLAVFQLELLFETIVFIDADAIVMRDPRVFFDLPFSGSVAAFGASDVYSCVVNDSFASAALNSALLVWRNERGSIRWSHRVDNAMADAAQRRWRYPGDQQIIQEVFADQLRILDESAATMAFRCLCRQSGRARRLSESIVVHFMHSFMPPANIARAIAEGASDWRTPELRPDDEIEPDCLGVAYARFTLALKIALAAAPPSVRMMERVPCTNQTLCSAPPVLRSTFPAANLRHLIDNDLSTVVHMVTPVKDGDQISIMWALSSPPLKRVSLAQLAPELSHDDFVIVADDQPLPASGLLYRRAREVRLLFLRDRNTTERLSFRELVMEPMPHISAKILYQSDQMAPCEAVNSEPHGARFVPIANSHSTWATYGVDAPLARELSFAVDSDPTTVAHLPALAACISLQFDVAEPLLAGALDLLSGAPEDNRTALRCVDVWINHQTLVAQNASGSAFRIPFAAAALVASVRIDFKTAAAAETWIREIQFVAS